MQTCEFCGTENNDLAKHCSACNEPLSAEVAKEDIKASEQHAHSRLMKKELIYGGIGLFVAVGLIFAGVRSYKRHSLQGEARAFYTQFVDVDSGQMGPFWKCITRSDKQPKDNIELASALEGAIVKSKGGYVKFAATKCQPIINATPGKLEALNAPAFLADAYANYIAATKVLVKQVDAYIASVAVLDMNVPRDDQLKKLAGGYHDGAETADAYAYDLFLRCAVPNFAKMKESQEEVEYLATALKDPLPHVERWRKDCYKLIEKTEGTKADPDFKKKFEVFSQDDRDTQAFEAVIKAANDKERRAVHEPFEKAWFAYGQAFQALKDEFAKYLAD